MYRKYENDTGEIFQIFHDRSRIRKISTMADTLIEKLEKLAAMNDISFNQLVIQCCEYALNELEKNEAE